MAGQELPIFFQINTICSQSTLQLSSSSLHFKGVFVDQKRTLPITITNTSYLPQKISFVKLKKEIDVQPNDGFSILLPNENFTFFVSFSPSSAVIYSFDLMLLTNMNDKIIIKITATGIECPLLFDYSNLFLRSTSPGEKVTENIIVRNVTDKKICFEFIVPDFRYSWLKISPTIIELNPSKSCRIEIEFIPPPNLINENPIEWFSQLKNVLSQEKKISDKNNTENENEKPIMTVTDNKIIEVKNNGNGADFRKKNDCNTTFDGFSDFENNDGFITVKNSFGEIQWARSTEFKLENIDRKENEVEDEMKNVENRTSSQIIGNRTENNYGITEVSKHENENKNENENKDENDRNQFLLSSIMERSHILSDNNSQAEFELLPNTMNNNESFESKKLKKEQNLKRKKEIELEKKVRREKEMEEERIVEKENEIIELKSDLSHSEWGVTGTWSIPIFIRAKNTNNSYTNKNDSKTDNEKTNLTDKTTTKKEKISSVNEIWNLGPSSDRFPPLFFGIQTVTILPQIEIDIKILDFGNMAIGSRIIKTVIISNLHYSSVQLITDNTNAVGPFTIINPLKTINTQEFKKIMIECIPTSSGLFTEKLEFRSSDEIGGHRIQIFLRAQGVTPSISLEGLLPPPKPWGIKSGSGILDFGNVLIGDIAISNFTVFNHSSFPITVLLTRAVAAKLSPYDSLNEITNRTISGIPIFNFRPEEMKLQPGTLSSY